MLLAVRALALLLLAIALPACEATVTAAPVASGIARSATIQPGLKSLDQATALSMFNEMCLRHMPNFAGTEASAAANGFVQHATYGTYYHARYNLSVKLIGRDCSMVFASTASNESLRRAFVAVPGHGSRIRFRTDVHPGGLVLHNVRIARR